MAVLSAAFCIICSLAMDEGDELGNQMGAAYVNRDLMRDLKVIVSFCWPQAPILAGLVASRLLILVPSNGTYNQM